MTPDYAMMQQLLRSALPELSPAALHGLLSGLLSSGAPDIDAEDVATVLQSELSDLLGQLIEKLLSTTLAQLQEPDFSFQLLLPSDDERLSLRVIALGEWCEGFTTGFAAGFAQGESALGAEGRESVTDIGQLASLSESGASAEEDEEADFMELVEYVRMAAVALFQQLAEPASSAEDSANPNQPVLH
jgi:uncharacterized protein